MTRSHLPVLPVDSWEPTRSTLHMWLQIVGKYRMVGTPSVNHWWHVPFYVNTRGLGTGLVPGDAVAWEAEFDFVAHQLVIRSAEGQSRVIALRSVTVAEFFGEVETAFAALGVHSRIHASPNEVAEAIPFADDTVHHTYDPSAAHSFWRQLLFAHTALLEFRADFTGKVSPVHFFWGAMDLAVTRFSGRRAPVHPGGAPNCPPDVMREGYSGELSSAGFFAGGGAEGAFYSYAYPAPEGYARARVSEGAAFDEGFGEFLLPFEAVRTSSDPRALVRQFLDSTFEVAAQLGRWAEAIPGEDPQGIASPV